MKIRNGFVSNSSSSSFIVAFPYKPKNVKEVLDIMFCEKEGREGTVRKISIYNESLTYLEVAERVFEDMKGKKATLKTIIEELLHRYYYRDESCGPIFYLDGWSCDGDKYYCCDKKTSNELKEISKQYYSKSRILYKMKTDLEIKNQIFVVPYAAIGVKNYKNKKYTKKEIKAYDDNQKRLKELTKNKEWIDICEAQRKNDMEFKKISDELSMKLAKADAEKFMDDNKSKHIFVVSYGDSMNSIMEHGNIFKNVSHIRVSHH